MLKDMAKVVEVGSTWYIVSMTWIARWQDFVGFDSADADEDIQDFKGGPPGQINNEDIIEPFFIGKDDSIISTLLEERSQNFDHMNVQLKKTLKEGDDYMLVDENIYNLWSMKYGKKNEIKRTGIEDENGETIVEIHLKVFNLYLIPNAKLFKMDKMLKKSMVGVAV